VKGEGVPQEGIRGNEDEVQTLREERDRLREQLDGAHSRASQAEQEKARERVRGWLALGLTGLLSFVLVATYAYLMILSLYFAEALSTQEVHTLIPMVGTTLLTPLVGLIGAVTGFYFGGLTAVQAASQGHAAAQEATQQGAQATQQGAQQGAQAATTGAQVATDGATQAATDAAVQAVTGQSPQQQTGDR
jgi:hypothetical protein